MNRKYKYPLAITINILLCPAVTPVSARQLASSTEGRQPVDSLSVYLEQAVRNNPQVNADFMFYKASLEKIPQVDALSDPELEIGLFIKPTETLVGKQVADFTLMQVFPWLGTRKVVRGEAPETARMVYEQFRDTRNNLQYEIKTQWCQFCNPNEQYRTMKTNIHLLCQLEQLALSRFFASSAQATSLSASSFSFAAKSISSMPLTPASGNDMVDMGGMGNAASAITSGTSIGTFPSGMSGIGRGSMGSTATGNMSDVLRIQMERAELEDNPAILQSVRPAVEARFNALLNRPSDVPAHVPDFLMQRFYRIDEHILTDNTFTRNPMITTFEAEGEAFRAKAKMERHMSYPVIGIGLQYSLVNKVADPMGMPDMNGKGIVAPMLKISLPLLRRKHNVQQWENYNYRVASELKHDNIQN